VEIYSTHSFQATGAFYNFQILFCGTDIGSLTTSFEANYDGGTPQEALYDDTLEIAWADSSPGWNGFDLERPFLYEGSGNLIVEFRYMGSAGTTINTRAAAITPSDRCLDGGYPTCPNGDLMSFLTGMRIHFTLTGIHEGGAAGVTGVPGISSLSPFSDILSLSITAPPGTEAVLSAFSSDGRLIGTLWRGVPGADGQLLEIDAGRFPTGLILLLLETDGARAVGRSIRVP
jgi:hypothetical protein